MLFIVQLSFNKLIGQNRCSQIKNDRTAIFIEELLLFRQQLLA